MTRFLSFEAGLRTAAAGRPGNARSHGKARARTAFSALLVLTGLLGTSSCGRLDEFVTEFRSTDGFIASREDPRVFYESGAEARSRPVVTALADAVAEVEAATYGPFVVPIPIYVCGTLDCYRRFTGSDLSGGQTRARGKIFISPKPENTAARVPFVLAHELTHLHLTQRCSMYRAWQLPIWFSEGFAALASKGGGAEDVTDAEAAGDIVAGRTFTPTSDRGFSGSHFGLSAHMFYRQAALFIDYLRANDAGAFRAFLLDIQDGRPFAQAFDNRLHTELIASWRAFIGTLAARAANGQANPEPKE